MKVFVSWSGERSRRVAELLNEWLKCAIQALCPWVSTDIDRGAIWFTEINNSLSDSSNGIICLTRENQNKPWILFEAGALARGLSTNRVCTFLVDLQPEDVIDPLAQFNHTMCNKSSMFNLIKTLNIRLGEQSLPDDVLSKVFDTYWPQFEQKFNDVLTETQTQDTITSKKSKRPTDDLLSEILYSVRRLDRRLTDIEINRGLSTAIAQEFDNNNIRSKVIKDNLRTHSIKEISNIEFDVATNKDWVNYKLSRDDTTSNT